MVLTICRQGFLIGLGLVLACAVQAQDLRLNGVADFVELRRPFYLGALYVERTGGDADALLESDQRKRMVLKATAERWSPRRFSNQWSRSLLINNKPEALNTFGEAVIEFNNLLQSDLVRGDTLEIERQSDGSSEVRLNGVTLLSVARPGFTEMLLRTWVGSRPPSSDFRRHILGENTSAERVARFEALGPSSERVALARAWSNGEELEDDVVASTEETAPETTDDANLEGAPPLPPGDETLAVLAAPVVSASAPQATTPEATAPTGTETSGGDGAARRTDESAPPSSAAEPEAAPAGAGPSGPAKAGGDDTGESLEPIKLALAAPLQMATDAQPQDAGLSDEEQEALIELYQNMVVRKILGQVQYPDYALRRGLEGLVQLRVSVDRKGKILQIEEMAQTRHNVLNDAGRRAVERVGDFPRVPAALGGDTIAVEVPIRFRLR